METFADRIYNLVMGLDIVDRGVFDKTADLIETYLQREIGLVHMMILRVDSPDGTDEVLAPVRDPTNFRPIFSGTGKRRRAYVGHSAYALDRRACLWVTGAAGASLAEASSYIDHWNGASDLPAYLPPAATPARARDHEIALEILIPFGGPRPSGVLDLECHLPIPCTRTAKRELLRIAEIVHTLVLLRENRRSQVRNSRRALAQLARQFSERTWLQLVRPRIFVAFPEKADMQIVDRIEAAVQRTATAYDLDVVVWDKMEEPGSINKELIRVISTCHFGVCYFSEPTSSRPDTGYRDNPNVLFEAGMLHSQTHNRDMTSFGWIPIREKRSPSPPFDFANERMVFVDRDEPRFARKLEDTLSDRLDLLVTRSLQISADLGRTSPARKTSSRSRSKPGTRKPDASA